MALVLGFYALVFLLAPPLMGIFIPPRGSASTRADDIRSYGVQHRQSGGYREPDPRRRERRTHQNRPGRGDYPGDYRASCPGGLWPVMNEKVEAAASTFLQYMRFHLLRMYRSMAMAAPSWS